MRCFLRSDPTPSHATCKDGQSRMRNAWLGQENPRPRSPDAPCCPEAAQPGWRFHDGSAVFSGGILWDSGQTNSWQNVRCSRSLLWHCYGTRTHSEPNNPFWTQGLHSSRAVMLAASGVLRRIASSATGFGYCMMTSYLANHPLIRQPPVATASASGTAKAWLVKYATSTGAHHCTS